LYVYSEENGKGDDDLDEPWIMTVKSTNCLKQLPEDSNYNFQNKKMQQHNGVSAPSTPSLPKNTQPSKTEIPINHTKSEKNNAVITLR